MTSDIMITTITTRSDTFKDEKKVGLKDDNQLLRSDGRREEGGEASIGPPDRAAWPGLVWLASGHKWREQLGVSLQFSVVFWLSQRTQQWQPEQPCEPALSNEASLQLASKNLRTWKKVVWRESSVRIIAATMKMMRNVCLVRFLNKDVKQKLEQFWNQEPFFHVFWLTNMGKRGRER